MHTYLIPPVDSYEGLIKLENNGNTFVVSPHPLPHLEALAL